MLSKKKNCCWGHEQEKAFSSLRRELPFALVLQLYNHNKQLKISANASSYRLRPVMLQTDGKIWSPVAYTLRLLTDTEQCYAQIKKEPLALSWAYECVF